MLHVTRMNLLLVTAKIEYIETFAHASLQVVLKIILAWDSAAPRALARLQFAELLDAGLIGALRYVMKDSIETVDFHQVDSGQDTSERGPMVCIPMPHLDRS